MRFAGCGYPWPAFSFSKCIPNPGERQASTILIAFTSHRDHNTCMDKRHIKLQMTAMEFLFSLALTLALLVLGGCDGENAGGPDSFTDGDADLSDIDVEEQDWVSELTDDEAPLEGDMDLDIDGDVDLDENQSDSDHASEAPDSDREREEEEESAAFEDYYYPPKDPEDDSWENTSPASLGWDESKLAEAVQYVAEHNSTGLVILHKGRMVLEEYWQEWDLHTADPIYSASKSVMAVLCGIALQDNLLQLSDFVSEHVAPGWSNAPIDKESLITVQHLLTMTSGLTSFLGYDVEAGTAWRYNTVAYKMLGSVLEAVSGQDLDEFAQSRLFAEIGMRESRWRINTSMDASARDMARFGLLMLSDGAWDGEPILTGQTYLHDMLNSSQALNEAYGYLWWLNGKDSYLIPGEEDTPGIGSIIPNAPQDMVAALGAGDKKIYIVPSLDLVVVRHGDNTGVSQLALSSFDNELWRLLLLAASGPSGSKGAEKLGLDSGVR